MASLVNTETSAECISTKFTTILQTNAQEDIHSTNASFSSLSSVSGAELQTDFEEDCDDSTQHVLSETAEQVLQQHGNSPFYRDLLMRALNRNNGNEKVALEKLEATLAWRQAAHIDTLLQEPQPHFQQIKAAYRHGVLCRAKDGATAVFVENTGGFRTAYNALHKQGVTDAAIVRHLLFVNEHLFTVTDPRVAPGGRVIKILDMAGASLADLKGASQRLLREFGNLQQSHYQDRMQVAFIVNAPGWWNMAWKVLQHLFEPNVRNRLQMLGGNKANIFSRLSEYIPESQIPTEYGGPCTRPLYASPDELTLNQHVGSLGPLEGPCGAPLGAFACSAAGSVCNGSAANLSSFQVGSTDWESYDGSDSESAYADCDS